MCYRYITIYHKTHKVNNRLKLIEFCFGWVLRRTYSVKGKWRLSFTGGGDLMCPSVYYFRHDRHPSRTMDVLYVSWIAPSHERIQSPGRDSNPLVARGKLFLVKDSTTRPRTPQS